MPLTVLDIVGHASFAIAAYSFYLRDMLLLRSLSIVSSGIGVVYNYFIQGGPLWLVIFWLRVHVDQRYAHRQPGLGAPAGEL